MASPYYNDPQPAAGRLGSVQCATNDLENAVCALLDSVNELGRRLAPVLSEAGKDGGSSAPTPGWNAPLAQTIQCHEMRVRSANALVCDFLARLEV